MTDNEKFMNQRREEAEMLQGMLNNMHLGIDVTKGDGVYDTIRLNMVQAMRKAIDTSEHFRAFYDWVSDDPKEGFMWFVVTTDRASGVKETELEKRFSHRF